MLTFKIQDNALRQDMPKRIKQCNPVNLEILENGSIEVRIPKVRLAITTLAPFSFAPYAIAFAAPPAPITTKSLLASGDAVGFVGCDAAKYWSSQQLELNTYQQQCHN